MLIDLFFYYSLIHLYIQLIINLPVIYLRIYMLWATHFNRVSKATSCSSGTGRVCAADQRYFAGVCWCDAATSMIRGGNEQIRNT